ncbi:MAG: acyltransferase family protein [Pseudomonadota bacterium]
MTLWDNAKSLAQQTPAARNRYVDFLRALSISVVVVGHWLMATAYYIDGKLIPGQILQDVTATQWITWLAQVMPVFFIVGGYANAVSLASSARNDQAMNVWLGTRLNRLVVPLLLLLVVWAGVAFTMLHFGARPVVVQYASQAALIPTWFLAIYLLVVVMAPATYRLWQRLGYVSVALFATGAVITDVCYFQFDWTFLGWTNFVWVWLAVHQLGYAWRHDRVPSVNGALLLSAAGLLALIALIFIGPYPLAMVGSPDEGLSNTSPPKVTLLALAAFQFGALIALQDRARRWLESTTVWAATVLVNGFIMTVYLWHITVMAIVTGLLYLTDGFGLAILPGSSAWWLTRPLWIVLLLIALAPVAVLLSPLERGVRNREVRIPPMWRLVLGALSIGLGVALLSLFGFAGGPIPKLDIAAFSLVGIGAAISGLWPAFRLPRLRVGDLKLVGLWFAAGAVVYGGYSAMRIAHNLDDAERDCFTAIAAELQEGDAPESVFRTEFERLQILVEKSLGARAAMLEIWNRLRENESAPISSSDLLALKDGTEYYLSIRKELYAIANTYECGVKVSDKTLRQYQIDPSLRVKGVLVSLGAALTLIDNYLLGLVLFENDDRLRNVINDPDQGFHILSNQLAEVTLAARSIEYRHRVRRALEFYERQRPGILGAEEDSDFAYLTKLIDSSPSYDYVREIDISEVASNKAMAVTRIMQDFVADTGSESVDVVSGLFGNTVGLVESRKGKLYDNPDVEAYLAARL